MKITRIETFMAPPRWMFVRAETDEGVVGWGEPVVEGRAEPVRAAVEVLSEYLIGQDPMRIEDHWQVMTKGGFYRGGPVLSSAVAGLDQALWDIKGKAYRPRLRARLPRPGLPANARRILPLLAPYDPMFVEEPVLSEYTQAVPDLVNASNIPIALGERLLSRREFLAPLQAGVAILQPDISHAGGISELRRIASLAEVYGAQIAPHCPLGPVALAASLQVAFTTPNFLIQEQSIGIHHNQGAELLDYVTDPEPFRFDAGSLVRTERPGLGVEVDEAAVRAADKKGHAWRNPVWRHEDDSFAEW